MIYIGRNPVSKLYVDGRKITGQELREPFDVLMGAYEVWYRRGQEPTQEDTYYRRAAPTVSPRAVQGQTDSRGTLLAEAAPDRETLIDSLVLTLEGTGSSKTVMVGMAGFEPATKRL